MIREVIKPQYTNFTINIPTSYIDKEVEFIMFPLHEQESIKETTIKKKKSLRGVFNKYADNSKIILEENAWIDHLKSNFKK